MRLSHSWRRLVLTVHIGVSVGWLGVAYTALVLAVVGATDDRADRRRAAYEVLDLLDLTAWLPLGALAAASGVLLAVGTKWGLVRHWWVLGKLVLTAPLLPVPLVFRGRNVDRALAAITAGTDPGSVGTKVVWASVASVVVLTVVTVLSTYKPGGRTRWRSGPVLRRSRRSVPRRAERVPRPVAR